MRRKQLLTLLLLTVFFLLIFTSFSSAAVDFDIERQDVEINIYEDWSVEIWYYLKIETTDGPHNGIYLGIPDSNISDFGASVENQLLTVEKTTYNGGDVLKIYFPETKYSGDVTEMLVSFWAYDRLYPDQTDDENMGIYFIPATWQGRTIPFQSITYILPEGVMPEDVKFVPNPDSMFYDDRTVVYFEKTYSTPESFDTNVLFPKMYLVPENEKRENPSTGGNGNDFSSYFFVIAGFIFFIVIILIIIGVIVSVFKGKKDYKSPEMAMESLGVRKDLDNVEAAVVLEANPIKVINLIVLGLVKKGLGVVESWGPLTMTIIKEEVEEEALKCPNCGAPLITGKDKQKCDYCGSEVEVRGRPNHYENQFILQALKKDGSLDEKGVRIMLENLSKSVNKKMRGYNRADTMKYYREKVESIWGDISSASEEEKYRIFGEDIGWLMLDEKYDNKIDSNFKDLSTSWTPASWWVWYNLGRASSLSGKEFSNNVKATNIETDKRFGVKSNKLKAALATPMAVAHAHKGKSSCACANCACACACVSCACACAGGGGF
jgi:hypothetical protein